MIPEGETYARLWIILGSAEATAREIRDTLTRIYDGWDDETKSHYIDPRERD